MAITGYQPVFFSSQWGSLGASMRIALVGTPLHPIPPPGYGPVERLMGVLVEGLQARGHHVDTFAGTARDTHPGQRILSLEQARRADSSRLFQDAQALFAMRVSAKIHANGYDVVHVNSNFMTLALIASNFQGGVISTIHSPLSAAQRNFVLATAERVRWVAISHTQVGVHSMLLPNVIPNAVDTKSLVSMTSIRAKGKGFLLQFARIHPNKGQHIAIKVARDLQLPLVLAGKVDHGAKQYFSEAIAPYLSSSIVWYPRVEGAERAELLADASVMLFPVQWEEPFGLAVVEAMASGTPVVGTARGALPELIIPGVTGHLASSEEDLHLGCLAAFSVDRYRCAEVARTIFSPERMVDDYIRVYEDVV